MADKALDEKVRDGAWGAEERESGETAHVSTVRECVGKFVG